MLVELSSNPPNRCRANSSLEELPNKVAQTFRQMRDNVALQSRFTLPGGGAGRGGPGAVAGRLAARRDLKLGGQFDQFVLV